MTHWLDLICTPLDLIITPHLSVNIVCVSFPRSVFDCGDPENEAGQRVRGRDLAHPRDRDHLLLPGRAPPHNHPAGSK